MDIALTSLQEQIVLYDELIVVDNGSTDKTVEIAEGYTDKIFSAPKGKLNALNIGISMASGDVILTVDCDCWYSPDYIERITKYFNDPTIKVLVVAAVHTDGASQSTNLLDGFKRSIGFALLKYGQAPARAFRREAFIQTGGFNLNVNQFDFLSVVFEEQINLHQRIAGFGNVIYDPSIVVHHRERRGICDSCQRQAEGVCEYCGQIRSGLRF